MGAFLKAAAEEPLLAEFCLVHAPRAQGVGGESCDEAGIGTMVEVMRGGREAGREARGEEYPDLPAVAEEFIAAGIVAVVSSQLRRGEAEGLPRSAR